jgi:hypothetical protein
MNLIALGILVLLIPLVSGQGSTWSLMSNQTGSPSGRDRAASTVYRMIIFIAVLIRFLL